jgi:hypothetical protein
MDGFPPASCVTRRLSDIYSPISSPATFWSPCESLLARESEEVRRREEFDKLRAFFAVAYAGRGEPWRLPDSSPMFGNMLERSRIVLHQTVSSVRTPGRTVLRLD